MPITVTEIVTPAGVAALRSQGSGVVSGDDAHKLQAVVRAHAGWPLLSFQEAGSSFSVEGRQAFVNFGETIPAIAVVVTSAPVRVMLSFIIRASQIAGAAAANVKFFTTESEAIAWLDAECAPKSARAS